VVSYPAWVGQGPKEKQGPRGTMRNNEIRVCFTHLVETSQKDSRKTEKKAGQN